MPPAHRQGSCCPCRFLEDVYMLPDPNAVRIHPLCLGSHCSLCGCTVCPAEACSLFYAKRFCGRWVLARCWSQYTGMQRHDQGTRDPCVR